MNDHLKQFATHSAYEAVKNNLDTPNVVLCTQEDEVHYNPYVDPFNGHAYVDLGLPSGTLWATMNVGANSVTDYGDYYKYGLGFSQYNRMQTDYSGTEDPLALSADTAAQVWGGGWHMPTSAQCQELIDNTIFERVTNYQGSGKNGGTFTASNGNVLFIPSAGHYYNGSIYSVNDYCYIWSSTPDGSDNAHNLFFYTNVGMDYDTRRFYGSSIRPVVG